MSAHPDTWAVLPVKSFALAKSRLSPVLSPTARAQVARQMLLHVLGVLQRAESIERVLVTTSCPQVAAVAGRHGASVTSEPPTEQLAVIVDHALAAVRARQALVLMADLPALSVADVRDALAPLRRGRVVAVAPDRHQMGTNALALRPPGGMPSCFGHDDSFLRHVTAAGALGVPAAVVRSVGLGLDLDTPEDLGALLQSHPEHALRAHAASLLRRAR